jgi:CDP-diacylglycerol--glycerol-3-phosphate 3-phosphatidyltransferase
VIPRERLSPFGIGWPNVISVLRVLLVPILVALILAEERTLSYIAAAVFLAGAVSDGLDGYLARRYDTTTRTGQWLDPLADKVLVSAPVIALTALGDFPLWAAAVIVVREVGIAVLRALLSLRGGSMPATRMAKAKTLFQLVAITLYILPLGRGADGPRLGVLLVAVSLTVYTGWDYVARAMGWKGRPLVGNRADSTGRKGTPADLL